MSEPRDFVAHQPVFCTSKYVFSADLAKHRALKEYAVQLLYRLAENRKVKVHAFCFLHNHFHVILSQPFPGHDPGCHEGIAYLIRCFKRRLSIKMNEIDPLHGGKFSARYHSVNLLTLEHYVNKMAYTVGQALNHGIDPEFILSSAELLCADINVVIRELPTFYRASRRKSRREMAQELADVLNATLDNYRALKAGRSLDPDRKYAAKGARARKMREARAKHDKRRAARQARRMRRGEPNYDHWKEAAQMALWHAGIDSEQSVQDLPRFRTQPLNPERWASDCRHLETWVCPRIENEHSYDERDRICATRLHVPGYPDVIVDWSLRMRRHHVKSVP